MATQLVISGNKILSHGEDCFLSMDGTVICQSTGKVYQNATVVTSCGELPDDIDSGGYEYDCGYIIPCSRVLPSTAELLNVCSCASVDEALSQLGRMLSANGLVTLIVKDEDNNPISDVTISGILGVGGTSVTTDNNGKAVVILTATTSVTFHSQYVDIPDYTQELTPNFSQLSVIEITMPYIETGSSVVLNTSGDISFRKSETVSLSLVGGGTGGRGGDTGSSSIDPGYSYGGSGGSGGKILNVEDEDVSGNYTLIVGAGGTGGNGGSYGVPAQSGTTGGNTTLGSWNSSNGTNTTLSVGGIVTGGTGGGGGNGGYMHGQVTHGYAGNSGSRSGGNGGNGGYTPNGGSYTTNPTRGVNGTLGGGGGGGGGGYSSYNGGYSSGAAGGNGGSGCLVILF